MCGITGWVSYDRDLTAEPERRVLAAMTKTMELRGPDAGGTWVDRHLGLGHRRLAIIDLAGGVQPMQAEENGRTLASLIFAGEIYNFTELRDELVALGQVFRTRSDTEVILRGYLQWGDGVVERLNGMFSFAIWDTRQEQLLLVRDRMGIKPLFYYPTADGVVFGSEPKALLANPLVPCRVDLDGLREVMVLAKNPERTAYAGMHEVRPGEIVQVDRAGLRKRRYWQLVAREHEDDLDRTIETVSGLLSDIVERQIITDVPLCSLLSGGLDSSAITALANQAIRRKQGEPVRSFSVDFANHGADFVPTKLHVDTDTPYVRDFVRHVGSNHTEVVLDSRELADGELARRALRACDFPPNTSGDMFTSLLRLCEVIKGQSTVALSGESADEVFGGYSWFHDPVVVAEDDFPWITTLRGKNNDGRSMLAPGLLEQLRLEEFQADSYRQAIAEVPRLASDTPHERRMREISYLHLTRFVQFLLDRKDRMSMAVGLEVRVPFCDHRLVEYVFNIPWRMKTFDKREKSVLRAAARPLLPDSIVKRVKNPYPSTQDPAYERALRADVATIAGNRSHAAASLFDPAQVRQALAREPGNVSTLADRTSLERVRSMSGWFEEYKPSLAA